MPRKNVKRKTRIDSVVDWKIIALATGEMPKAEGDDAVKKFMWKHPDKKKMRADWLKYRDMIFPDYVEKYPGKRPWGWWAFDTPRWSKSFNGAYFEGKLPEPRERIGGVGDPQYEHLAVKPRFSFGIPIDWIEASSIQFFSDNFKGVPLDKDDPPMYEAQASYLKRHSLLTNAEERRLKPSDFEPESCLKYVKTYENDTK